MAGMAEYIEREALRDALYDADAITMQGVKILNQFPTADVVPVVRCRECKWKYEGYDQYCCIKHTGMVLITPDSFCSYGEKREVRQNG